MEIAPANLLDLFALRQLEQVCFPKDAWPLLDLIAVLTFPGVIRLKAVENTRMIGFIAGDPRPSEQTAWIATLGVSPEHRRRGIAQQLLSACEAQMPQPRLRLSVRVDNPEAIHLYQKNGYKVVETWQGYYNDKTDALIMEKWR